MLKLENRIPPPIILFVTLVLMYLISRFDSARILKVDNMSASTWGAAFFVFLGVLFTVLGIKQFREAQTTINPLAPHASTSLVVTGIYQFTRNPMYLGMALIALGSVLYYGSAWCLIALFGFTAYITRYQIVPEERAMRALFGDEFESYKAKTRRWI